MIDPTRSTRFGLAVVAAGILLTSGCTLPHASRPFPYSAVSPRSYCPGDVVTASYELTRDAACVSRPGFDCATTVSWPAITIDSTPMSFPPRTFTTSGGGLDFAPTAPSVDVTFSPPGGSASFLYPSVDAAGTANFTSRSIRTQTHTVERIDGSIARALTHGGVCSGTTPAHTPATIAEPPEFSPSLRIQQVCNTSAVPIVATLSGASGDISRELPPGACFVPNEPGMPAVPAAGSTLGVRGLTVDPVAQCNQLQGMTPPTSLTTRAVLACGN